MLLLLCINFNLREKEIVMNKTIMALAATIAMSSAALAADLPSRKAVAVPPPPVMTWTGPYVGVNLGGGWTTGTVNNGVTSYVSPVDGNTVTVLPTSNNGSLGIVGGVTGGYNYQVSPMFVVGAETDFNGSTIGSGVNANNYIGVAALNAATGQTFVNDNVGKNINWFGTVRGRVGVVPLMPNLMVYGTGGFAYAGIQRVGGINYNNTTVQTGWTAGGGVEYKFNPSWSTKVEYLYTNVSGNNQNNWFNTGASINNVNNKTQFNTVRAGINYNFATENLPTLAKY
jgi:outer membrane immunogenic protein